MKAVEAVVYGLRFLLSRVVGCFWYSLPDLSFVHTSQPALRRTCCLKPCLPCAGVQIEMSASMSAGGACPQAAGRRLLRSVLMSEKWPSQGASST